MLRAGRGQLCRLPIDRPNLVVLRPCRNARKALSSLPRRVGVNSLRVSSRKLPRPLPFSLYRLPCRASSLRCAHRVQISRSPLSVDPRVLFRIALFPRRVVRFVTLCASAASRNSQRDVSAWTRLPGEVARRSRGFRFGPGRRDHIVIEPRGITGPAAAVLCVIGELTTACSPASSNAYSQASTTCECSVLSGTSLNRSAPATRMRR